MSPRPPRRARSGRAAPPDAGAATAAPPAGPAGTGAVGRYPKPAVLARIPLDRHVVIEASAGTGKTYALEHLIVEILLDRDPRRPRVTIDQILVVTFTERATVELRQRVRETLRALLHAAAGAAPPAAAGAAPPAAWELDDEARRRLREALASFDAAPISTIHGFCQRVLTEHAFPHRRLFEQELVDGRETFGRVFRETLRADLARDPDLAGLLRLALTHGFSVARLEDALYQCHRESGALEPRLDAPRLCAVLRDFPAAAIADPGFEAVLKAAGVHANSVRGVAARLRALAPLCAAHADGARLPELLAAWEEHREDLAWVDLRLAPLGDAGGVAGQVRAAVVALGAAAVPLIALLAERFLPVVRARLERRKRERGLFDFDDMLGLVEATLADPVRGPDLAALLRQRYRYALIDEFQDTDPVQWRIFARLFGAGAGATRLVLIGDPKQAIYGFRGADVTTYVAARDELLAGGAAAVRLERNFRSTARLIEGYNRILAQDATPPFFQGTSITYPVPVTCGAPERVATDAAGELAVPICVWQLDGGLGSRAALQLLAARIARECVALLGADPRPLVFSRPGHPALTARDLFVLTRTAREGRVVGAALRAAGVPHAYYKEEGLFRRAEARDLRDLLLALADPRDRAARLRAWLTPFFDLSLAAARDCRDLPGSHPLVQRLLDWHALAARRDYPRLFERVLADSGLVHRELFFEPSERELTNYLHLVELLLEEAGRGGGTVADLAATLTGYIDGTRTPRGAEGDVQRLESDRDAVQIMTMHKAKGLEAAVVFVAGGFARSQGPVDRPPVVHPYHDGARRVAYLGEGALPLAVEAAVQREEAEADERLLYVALTRAQARIYLPYFTPQLNRDGSRSRAALPHPTAAYARVNARLEALLVTGPEPAAAACFAVEEVGAGAEGAGAAGAGAAGAGAAAAPTPLAAVATWRPAPALLAAPAPALDFAAARRGHRGYLVTSYTRMSHGLEGRPGTRPAPPAPADLALAAGGGADLEDERADPGAAAAPVDPDDLPPGARTGIYLHAMLEAVDLPTLAAAPPFEAWSRRPEVRDLFAAAAPRYGVASHQVRRAQALVHTALTAPLGLGGGVVIPGLASAAEQTREMEFVYPLPERGLPGLAAEVDVLRQIDAGGVRLDAGFVRGFVDYLFVHEGLAYFVDWKGNVLPRYDGPALAAYVAESYRYQERLYALALLKLLRVRSAADHEARFGGFLYCFLRGMLPGAPAAPAGAPGVYFHRPAWPTILAWEAELAAYGDAVAGRDPEGAP